MKKVSSLLLIVVFLFAGCSSLKNLEKEYKNKYSDILYIEKSTFLEYDKNKISCTLSFKGDFTPNEFQELCESVEEFSHMLIKEKDYPITSLGIKWYSVEDVALWSYDKSYSTSDSGHLRLHADSEEKTNTRSFYVKIDEIAKYVETYDSSDVITLPADVPKPEISFSTIEDGVAYFDVLISSEYDWDNGSLENAIKIATLAIQKCEMYGADMANLESISILATLSDGHRAFIYHDDGIISFYSKGGKDWDTYIIPE